MGMKSLVARFHPQIQVLNTAVWQRIIFPASYAASMQAYGSGRFA
jgi:hypothetical protein